MLSYQIQIFQLLQVALNASLRPAGHPCKVRSVDLSGLAAAAIPRLKELLKYQNGARTRIARNGELKPRLRDT